MNVLQMNWLFATCLMGLLTGHPYSDQRQFRGWEGGAQTAFQDLFSTGKNLKISRMLARLGQNFFWVCSVTTLTFGGLMNSRFVIKITTCIEETADLLILCFFL